jgi:hypothetical protein
MYYVAFPNSHVRDDSLPCLCDGLWELRGLQRYLDRVVQHPPDEWNRYIK